MSWSYPLPNNSGGGYPSLEEEKSGNTYGSEEVPPPYPNTINQTTQNLNNSQFSAIDYSKQLNQSNSNLVPPEFANLFENEKEDKYPSLEKSDSQQEKPKFEMNSSQNLNSQMENSSINEKENASKKNDDKIQDILSNFPNYSQETNPPVRMNNPQPPRNLSYHVNSSYTNYQSQNNSPVPSQKVISINSQEDNTKQKNMNLSQQPNPQQNGYPQSQPQQNIPQHNGPSTFPPQVMNMSHSGHNLMMNQLMQNQNRYWEQEYHQMKREFYAYQAQTKQAMDQVTAYFERIMSHMENMDHRMNNLEKLQREILRNQQSGQTDAKENYIEAIKQMSQLETDRELARKLQEELNTESKSSKPERKEERKSYSTPTTSSSTSVCPICQEKVPISEIDEHVNICLDEKKTNPNSENKGFFGRFFSGKKKEEETKSEGQDKNRSSQVMSNYPQGMVPVYPQYYPQHYPTFASRGNGNLQPVLYYANMPQHPSKK